jgi:hypothetical protein
MQMIRRGIRIHLFLSKDEVHYGCGVLYIMAKIFPGPQVCRRLSETDGWADSVGDTRHTGFTAESVCGIDGPARSRLCEEFCGKRPFTPAVFSTWKSRISPFRTMAYSSRRFSENFVPLSNEGRFRRVFWISIKVMMYWISICRGRKISMRHVVANKEIAGYSRKDRMVYGYS